MQRKLNREKKICSKVVVESIFAYPSPFFPNGAWIKKNQITEIITKKHRSTHVLMPWWCLVATTRANFFLHNSAILSH